MRRHLLPPDPRTLRAMLYDHLNLHGIIAATALFMLLWLRP